MATVSEEEHILCRVAANHLLLGQFESLRASFLSLREKNANAAIAVLRTVVALGGRVDGILFSAGVPSSAHLTWMCLLELRESESRLLAGRERTSYWVSELCLVENIEFVEELVEMILLLEELQSESRLSLNVDDPNAGPDHRFTDELVDAYRIRLEDNMKLSDHHDSSLSTDTEGWNKRLQEWVKLNTLAHPQKTDALCRNISRQKAALDDQEREERQPRNEASLDDLGLKIQKLVQQVHLQSIKDFLNQEDSLKAIHHVRYLQEEYGIPKDEYSAVVSMLAEHCFKMGASIDKPIPLVYENLLSTGSQRLLSVFEASRDKMILEENVLASSGQIVPPPIKRLLERLDACRKQNISVDSAVQEFMPDMYNYARVESVHVLEKVVSVSLDAIRNLQLEIAADVLLPFPRLRSLVAVMGWDLLPGKTAARRRLMELLWYSTKSGKEQFWSTSKHPDENSCIEHLCDKLLYDLEVAYFVSNMNTGVCRRFEKCHLFSRENTVTIDDPVEPFASNLVLERLAVNSLLRVIFDTLPNIELQDAFDLVKMQPVCSPINSLERHLDVELLHMYYGLRAAVTAMRTLIEGRTDVSLTLLKDLQRHLESISSPARRLWMLEAIVSLLHMKEDSLQPFQPVKQESPQNSQNQKHTVAYFVKRILGIIDQHLPSSGFDLDLKGARRTGSKERRVLGKAAKDAWMEKSSVIRHFIQDWEWRLVVLRRLYPAPIQWQSATKVLHCSAPTLLNMCFQKAEYDLAQEAVIRFSLRSEDAVLLRLAQCFHNISSATPDESVISELSSILGASSNHFSSSILCLDVAATYAPTLEMSKHFIELARGFLYKFSLENLQNQSLEADAVMVKLVLNRLQELLEQTQSLPKLFSGADYAIASSESTKQGARHRALTMLHQIIEDAHNGKGQFLSGKLHNLVKALADEELDETASAHGLGLGLGLTPLSNASSTSATAEATTESSHHGLKGAGKRFLGPIINKPTAYLSAFILYVAAVGDIVDGVDTTHDFNFFSLLYERPGDLLTRLVFERGSTDGAAKVAEIMGADLVHQVISACVPGIYPPTVGGGWASVAKRTPHSPLLFGNCLQTTNSDSPSQHAPTYNLDLDVVKYLATLSPVRAILACVFGSSRESENGFDFAVEQAERFPTLQHWIQMQANLQRLCESPISSKISTFKQEPRSNLKRMRDSDPSDEEQSETNFQEKPATHTYMDQPKNAYPVLLDWDDERPYQEAVEGLIREGKLVDALAFADRWLSDGAPDKLLQLLVERGEDSVSGSGNWHGSYLWNNSYQYCIRLRDKRLAATLALKYIQRWELDAAIDVLTMCSCHLPPDDSLLEEVLRVKHKLQQCGRILREDLSFRNWKEVEALCQSDPEGLALRLAGKGAVTAALEVAETFKLSDDLRRELQGRQLVKLLAADPISGGGPAEALRFLGQLHRPEDALPVAMAAMEQLPNLQSKQLLVHFLLRRQIGMLTEQEHARMDRLALGLKMLGALPLPWQQRCSGLHEHPQLIFETLLMWKQLQAASQLLDTFPSLRNDKLIITYATKAVAVTGSERQHYSLLKVSSSYMAPVSKVSGGNGIGREARRAFSWTRDTRNKIMPKDSSRKRKSALPPSQKAAWEAMAGYHHEDRPIGLGQESYEKLAPLTMADEWVLTGDPMKDDTVRNSHRYESAPSFVLFKSLLSLCSDQAGAAKAAVELCVSQSKAILSSEYLPLNAGSEAIERAFHAAETFVQVLLDARTELRKVLGNAGSITEMSSETSKEENQYVLELRKLLSEAEIWLDRVELLQSLLGSGVTASLEDVNDEQSALLLRDRLISEERFGMAVYTCTKCKIDVFPVWEAWGYALLYIEHYAQARVKFKKSLQLYNDDPAAIVQKIVDIMEASPPADVAAARFLYSHMAKSVLTSSDDSLSADSYLNVLYIPTFSRAGRSRSASDEGNVTVASSMVLAGQYTAEDGPKSNLDNSRYEECKYYLVEYAPQRLLQFMFRHGRYNEACQLFFPLGGMPSFPATASGNSKVDSLATDYGTIDDVCDFCVGYGAIPNLELAIAARILASGNDDAQVSQHTSAALTRICTYFETHRHFNHLYRFQILKKDYIAAGLCCIQLFLNSSNQEQAIRHLEHGKAHFEEGLGARQQIVDNAKAAAKVSRGRSPSEKLTDEDLIKFSARVTIQMEVVRCFSDVDGPPWKHSLFGNPNDADTFKRRCEISEALVEKNFDLAFQIIYDFNLPAVYIYAGVAAGLADRRKYNNLVELLRNVKGTIEDDDWDQIVGAAISVYANKHRERPDRLVEMLSSSHRKVLACVICGRLKSAFQIASRSGSITDVEWVAQQARMTGALPVEDMCKQWLARAS